MLTGLTQPDDDFDFQMESNYGFRGADTRRRADPSVARQPPMKCRCFRGKNAFLETF